MRESEGMLSAVLMFVLGLACVFLGIYTLVAFPGIGMAFREMLAGVLFIVAIWLFFDFASNAYGRTSDDERQSNHRTQLRERLSKRRRK